ncbi:MAG TPA: hypothetical protein VJU54_12305 [Nitrospiraceae bacterium]|nr:hypothetical protein [Nitrospiraceae bacterium]
MDYIIDPQVRTLIDVAQQAIEAAKHLMEQTPQDVDETKVVCIEEYQRAA